MIVSKKHKKLVLNLKDPDRITALIPSARLIQYKGRTLVAVPHKLDEVRVLRNLGLDAPAPMGSYYDWPGRYQPYAHQKVCAEFLTMNPRAFNLSGMGSGKTVTTLWAFDYLKKAGLVKRMLIISPLSTLERAWGDEIFRHFPELTFTVLHGTREKRHKLIANDFDIYIINHDGIKSADTIKLLAQKEGLDLIVIDEIATFRTAGTDRFKALNTLVNGNEKLGFPVKKWAWGLTGTPIPNAPTDAWAQIRVISPSRVPRYFGAFRDSVMRQVTPFMWQDRDGALEQVHAVMQPAIRFAREDCIDLPPTTYVTRHCELSPEQQKLFDEMVKQLKAEVAGGQITAINEAVKMSKLLQICSGVAYSDAGDVLIPAPGRIALLKEIIAESEAKVLVFVPFTGALKAVAAELAKDYTVEVVYGGVSKTQRDQIFKDFQQSKNPHVLVADARTMSHGLSFTAASTTIWYGPTTSNETYMQANERTARPGQKLNTLIVNIESTVVERKMYDRLASKGKTQGILLDMLKGA